MSNKLEIFLNVIWDKAKQEMADMEIQVNKIGALWQRVKQKVKSEIRGVIGSMQAFVNLFSNVLQSMGIALDPVGVAIVAAIQTTLASVLAMHRVLEASSFGVMAVATVAMSAIAIGMAGGAITAAMLGMDQMKSSMNSAVTTANSAVSLVTSFNWI